MMRKKKGTSIKTKVFLPILGMMILQVVAIVCAFLFSGTLTQLERSAFKIFDNAVSAKQKTLETQMLQWMDFGEYGLTIDEQIKRMSTKNNQSVQEFLGDTDVRHEALEEVSDDILKLLRHCETTGAFIILDGDSGEKDSFYIRNLNPRSVSKNNYDILAEAGPGTLLKEMGLTMDSHWKVRLNITEQDDFYQKPFQAGNEYTNISSKNLGYWSPSFRLREKDIEIITYAVPLLDENHKAYGVLGVEISLDYLKTFLPSEEISIDPNASYYMGVTTDGERYRSVLTEGSFFRAQNNGREMLRLKEDRKYKGFYNVNEADYPESYVSVRPLKLYNSNTPFEQESWVLGGFVQDNAIHQYSDRLIRSVLFVLAVTFIVSLGITTFIVAVTVRPINRLMGQLKNRKMSNLDLSRTGIREIDNLSETIEKFGRNIEQSAYKMSTIMDMTEMPLGVFEYDPDSNEVFCTKEVLKLMDSEYPSPDSYYVDRKIFEQEMARFQEQIIKEPFEEGIYQMVTREGHNRWLHIRWINVSSRRLCVMMDMTKEVREKQKIKYERDYDVLTNLLNRRAIVDKVKQLLHSGQVKHAVFSIWDLDNLKYFNDTYGHDMGDKYICRVADVLNTLKGNSLLARMAGDEFIVFLYGDRPAEDMCRDLYRLHEKILGTGMMLPDQKKVFLSASAGIAIYPQDAQDYEGLLRYADFAMYEMKSHSKGNIKLFNKDSYLRDKILLQGGGELTRVLNEGLIDYVFQPIVDARTGEIFAYEALMRPQSELLSTPADIIRLARIQSRMNLIEYWTWFNALKAFDNQPENEKYRLFLNSLPDQCLDAESFRTLEEKYGPLLNRTVVEVTENAGLDTACMEQKRQWCGKWNMQFALDDFGVGYSNNAALLYIDPAFVKVDQYIIREIDKEGDRQKLVKGLIDYCHEKGSKIIAEGVETWEELEESVLLGADYIQGFCLARADHDLKDLSKETKERLRRLYRKVRAAEK
ncbi:EAL domain-containing protein [Anaerolentibacter hominis]|uniref:EAL domain-containing protein n=1 Tax=Anaerolentibacter hominis TaxID=3079009 RepID=UPI0031B827D2